jgi:hypothetical protein
MVPFYPEHKVAHGGIGSSCPEPRLVLSQVIEGIFVRDLTVQQTLKSLHYDPFWRMIEQESF